MARVPSASCRRRRATGAICLAHAFSRQLGQVYLTRLPLLRLFRRPVAVLPRLRPAAWRLAGGFSVQVIAKPRHQQLMHRNLERAARHDIMTDAVAGFLAAFLAGAAGCRPIAFIRSAHWRL